MTDANSHRHLNFAYYEDLHLNPAWISSELQNYLMVTMLRDDGTTLSRLEAVDITVP